MGLLSKIVKVSVGELCSICGHLYGEATVNAVGALAVYKSKTLVVSRGKYGGNLEKKRQKMNLPTQTDEKHWSNSSHLLPHLYSDWSWSTAG